MDTPILFLMCGLPCSGKTTRAKDLEKQYHALRLTPDEWMKKIVGDGFDEEKRTAIETIMISIAERCLALGINVILDFGFWSHAERNAMMTLGDKLGARTELHFLDTPLEELLERMRKRNASSLQGAFGFTEEHLQLWINLFEAPNKQELKQMRSL